MTYLEFIWKVCCTEFAILGFLCIYAIALGIFGNYKDKDFDHYDE